ncbi:MAG: glycosyl transferase family 1 [Candidatus Roseilinea sp.]|nr:MAG: glycosyl transferase family 1 [Candidatus Roseilinea sp.]
MNLLFVIPYVPTLIRVRPYNLVRFLARHGHRLTLATLWETNEERRALAELESLGIEIVAAPLTRNRKLLNLATALPSTQPLQANFCWQPALATKLEVLILVRDFDAIHVEHLRGSRYALQLKRKTQDARRRTPIVWDSVDSITHLFEQAARRSQSLKGKLMTAFELPRTRRHEGWLAAQFDHVLVTSPTDRAALEAISPRHAPITVLPNGVDLHYFAPCEGATRESDALVFSGKMSYHANITAALHLVNDIMPRVWAQKPQVRLWIVGKDPPDEVCALEARHPEQVKVTGAVPDMRAYLQCAAVAVVPVVYGAGIQNKVLEAMACATPVVTSAQTVTSLQPGYESAALVAGDAEAFAHHVLRLLDDPSLRAQLGAAGRRYVEMHHDWNVIVDRLAKIYEEAMH